MTETLVGQFPKHIGSTGGLLNSAETEEKHHGNLLKIILTKSIMVSLNPLAKFQL